MRSSTTRSSVRGRWLATLIAVSVLIFRPAVALANGGTIQLANKPIGPYLITVMTSPSPLQVGGADVSVLVTEAETKAVVEDATVFVSSAPVSQPNASSRFAATHANATNKLFYAANVPFSKAGQYRLSVHLTGQKGSGVATFTVDVAAGFLNLSPGELFATLIPIAGLVAWLVFRSRSHQQAPNDQPFPDPGQPG